MVRLSALPMLLIVTLACSDSDSTEPVRSPVHADIAVYADDGAEAACALAARKMFEWMGYSVATIDADYVNNVSLDGFRLVYFPGGNTGPYQRDISATGRQRLTRFVEAGGAFIGTCAGGFYACRGYSWQGGPEDRRNLLGLFPGRGEGPVVEIVQPPCIGMCRVDLVGSSHPITNGLPDTAWVMYYNGPHFWPDSDLAIDTIATYTATGQVAFAVCEYGQGRVAITGPHPEWEEDSDRDSVGYFDDLDDRGSDWPLMQRITQWCLKEF